MTQIMYCNAETLMQSSALERWRRAQACTLGLCQFHICPEADREFVCSLHSVARASPNTTTI